MSVLKRLLSKLWKVLPRALRWRGSWALSNRYVVGVAGVVVNARGELLLAHHVYRTRIVWGLPGGAVKHGEGLAEALRREIMEETGLDVQVEHLLQVHLDARFPFLTCFYLCSAEGTPQLRVNSELFEAGFYTLDVLPGVIEAGQWMAIQRGLRLRERPDLVLAFPIAVETNEELTAKRPR